METNSWENADDVDPLLIDEMDNEKVSKVEDIVSKLKALKDIQNPEELRRRILETIPVRL